MATNSYALPIMQALQYLSRTCSVFREDDSQYAPTPAQFTVAQHVAHVAQTIDWFIEGGFRDEGFDLDFAAHQIKVRETTSLATAFSWLARSVDGAADVLANKTQEEMMAPIAAGPIMGGEPRAAIIAAIAEHTAHHRGSLAVYARVLGYSPPMPYMD
ncbi:MAG: DinB family protein [Candidatus Krumholzibacteria bacterium]|nr:DinB family protein [Candidatus Krumholzibacteria bacterium]